MEKEDLTTFICGILFRLILKINFKNRKKKDSNESFKI